MVPREKLVLATLVTLAAIILVLMSLLISWSKIPSGSEGANESVRDAAKEIEVSNAIILKYRDGIFDMNPWIMKLRDRIYLFYSISFRGYGIPQEYVVIVLKDDLTPLFRVKLSYLPWKVQKYNESRFISMRGWNPVTCSPGHLIMYDEEFNVRWYIGRNFTDFEVVNGTIYALEYRYGDYYLDEINSEGYLTRSARVIDRGETGIFERYLYTYMNYSSGFVEDPSWRWREYCGEYPVLLPNLERLDDGLYMVWYGRPENNSTTRTKVRVSKVGFEGRSYTREVEIGSYELGETTFGMVEFGSGYQLEGLSIAGKGGEISLLRLHNACELIYLDKEGKIVGNVNLSDRILKDVLGGSKFNYGCLGSVHVGKSNVYVSGQFAITAEIRIHFLTIVNGTELGNTVVFMNVMGEESMPRYLDISRVLLGGDVLYVTGRCGRAAYVAKVSPSLVGAMDVLKEVGLDRVKVISIEDIPEKVQEP